MENLREQTTAQMLNVIHRNVIPQLAGYQQALDELTRLYLIHPLKLANYAADLRTAANATPAEVNDQIMSFEGQEEAALPPTIAMPSWHREVNRQRREINLLENQGQLMSGVTPEQARRAISRAKQYLYGMQTELEGPQASDQGTLEG